MNCYVSKNADSKTCGSQSRRAVNKFHILDMINTDKSANELLDHRVAQVNKTGVYENAICCSSGEYVDRLRAKGHIVYVVDTPRGLSPWALICSIWKTYQILRKHKFDIIHTHGSVIGVIGRMAAFMACTPIVIHQVHGFHQHDAMNRLRKWLFTQVEKLLALITNKLLFQNKVDIDKCLYKRIAPEKKLVLVGNGIQLDCFNTYNKPDNEPKVIVCVARFEPVKNHRMVLEAAEILNQRRVPFTLQLVGDGELIDKCKGWVREHGLENVVHFLGYRDDVSALTTNADICVLASIKEGIPRAIMEAAAAGRPMITTNVVGNRDALIDGTTGFLVPLNDASALADKIELLLSDDQLRMRIGLQAHEYALQHYDEKVVTDRIINVYNEMTKNLQ